jgi:hypothetical protein
MAIVVHNEVLKYSEDVGRCQVMMSFVVLAAFVNHQRLVRIEEIRLLPM